MFLLLLCSCLLFIEQSSFAALTQKKPSYAAIAQRAIKKEQQLQSAPLETQTVHAQPQYSLDEPTQLLTLAWQASQSPGHKKNTINLYKQFVATYPDDPRTLYARLDLAHLSASSTSADQIDEILFPILTLDSSSGFDPHWLAYQQLYACGLITQHYKQEKKEKQTLACLLNMLGIALNNDMHIQNNEIFPLHSPVVVKDLATLLRDADHHAHLIKWLGESNFNTDDQQKFLEQLYTYAHQYENNDGTFLLAQHILEAHATLNASILTKLTTLINKLQVKADKIILLKQIFAKTFGNDKMQAAYHLGMFEENPIKAGIYQGIAASNPASLEAQQIYRLSKTIKNTNKQDALLIAAAKEGHQEACKEALKKADNLNLENEKNKNLYLKLVTAAAQGGNADAQLSLGLLWKKKTRLDSFVGSSVSPTGAHKKTIYWLKQASKKLPIAKLEIATIGKTQLEVINNLLPYAKNNKFPLQTEAQVTLAGVYEAYGETLSKENKRQDLIALQRKHAIEWLSKAAKSGDRDVQLEYATTLVRRATHNFRQKGEYRKVAEQTYLAVVQHNPKYAPAHIKLASLYALQHKHADAQKHYIEALKQDPKDKNVINTLLGYVNELLKSKKYDLMKKISKSMLNVDQNNANALNNMGTIAGHIEKDTPTAIHYLTRAGDVGSAIAWRNLGSMYLEGDGVEKNLEIAISHYEKARKIEPKHANTLRILGALYENTGQDTKSYYVASDWAKTMDPDGILQMAIYAHTGYADAYNPTHASKLYRLAAQRYRLLGKLDTADEATLLSEITNYQRRDFFAQRIGDNQKTIKEFRAIKQRLDALIKMKSIPMRMKHEVKIALATQFINIGEYYSDKNKQAECFNNALSLLKDLPAHIACGNYNHATLLFEKYLAPKLTELAKTPFAELDSKTKEIATKARTLYAGIYTQLKEKQPHNAFLLKTYNNYGLLLKRVFDEDDAATEVFECGVKVDSVTSMLSLSLCELEKVKTLDDFNKPIKILLSALIQAQKDRNPALTMLIQKRLDEINEQRNKFNPDSIVSDACSSSATNQTKK